MTEQNILLAVVALAGGYAIIEQDGGQSNRQQNQGRPQGQPQQTPKDDANVINSRGAVEADKRKVVHDALYGSAGTNDPAGNGENVVEVDNDPNSKTMSESIGLATGGQFGSEDPVDTGDPGSGSTSDSSDTSTTVEVNDDPNTTSMSEAIANQTGGEFGSNDPNDSDDSGGYSGGLTYESGGTTYGFPM